MRKDDPQINLRIPPDLKDRIQREAKENRRTQTAEIIARLQASLDDDSESKKPTAGGSNDLADGRYAAHLAERIEEERRKEREELMEQFESAIQRMMNGRNLDDRNS